MPSGAKKRKAAKRKQQQATNPHPPLDSASDPPLNVNGSFHGNGNGAAGHDEFSDNHPSTDEELQEEKMEDLAAAAAPVDMESSENGKGEPHAALGTKEELPSVEDANLEFTTEEVNVEFVRADEGVPDEIGSEEKSAAVAAAVPVVQAHSANEEGVQTCEAIAETSDAVVDSWASESLVKVVSVIDTAAVMTSEVPPPDAAVDASSAGPTSDAAVDASASESLVKVVSVVDTAAVVTSEVSEPEPCAMEIPMTSVATERVTPAPLIVHRATWWNCCGLLDAFTGSQR